MRKSKLKSSVFSEYIQNNVLPFPLEKDLKKVLKSVESQRKSLKRESKSNGVELQLEKKWEMNLSIFRQNAKKLWKIYTRFR